MENLNLPSLESPELKALVDSYRPFFIEARRRIFFLIGLFVVATLGGFIFYESIIKYLIQILGLTHINIVFTSPFQFINLAISCGVATGLVVSFPLFMIQLMWFLKPALKRKEFKAVMGVLPFSLALFLLGFLFGAFVMRWQIEIFLERSVALGIGNMLDISNLLRTVILTAALMGVGFQFPTVLLLLLKLKIVKPKTIARQRKWVYVGSMIFAIVLPPDSILADILLSLPLVILFELTLLLSRAKKNP